MIGRRHLHGGAMVRLLFVVVLLQATAGGAAAHQSDTTQSLTTSAASGTVLLQPTGADAVQLGSDAQSTGWGDVLQVGDDGEAALIDGAALTTRVFDQSQARVLGSTPPDNDPAAA